jgi:hypothetical protein
MPRKRNDVSNSTNNKSSEVNNNSKRTNENMNNDDYIGNLIKGAEPFDPNNDSNTPRSSLKKINNEQSNFLDSINQSENNKYLNNEKIENTTGQFININESQKLTDNNMNDYDPNDIGISQKKINNSDNIGGKEDNPKEFTNTGETPKLQNINVNDNDPKDIEQSQKTINNSIKNESSYNNFDINKNYFFGCPLCLNIPYIESISFDMSKNIILVAYICKCDLKERKNPVNLSYLIIEKAPKNECQSHYSKELVYYCETCRLKICIDCYKEEHNNHEVNNNYLMSEKNEKNLIILIDKYKENLDKYDILKKIYDEYIKEKNTNNIEKINDNFNIINDNNFPNKINNDKLENGSINLKESHSNGKQIDISKNVFESGIQIENKFKQSVSNQNFNIKNSLLEEIIKKQNKNNNNNPSLYTSIKDNKNINNLNIDESQNNNDFRLFESRQINALNDSYEKPKNISLPPITEENNENKNITINEKINTINPKNEKLKYYYNCKTLKGHSNRVISLIQLESGYLVSGSSDGEIIIWDIYKNKLIRKFYEIGQVLCLLEFETNQLELPCKN